MKKEYSILIVLSALMGSAVVGYVLTKPGSGADLTGSQAAALGRFSGNLTGTQETTLPVPDGLFQINKEAAIAPAGEGLDDVIFYHTSNGFVSRVDIPTRKGEILSQTALPGLRDVIWSPNRQKVVTVFSGPVFQYYNYQTGDNGDLPAGVSDAVFSPDGNSLALVFQTGAGSDIVITNTDGTNPRLVLKTRLPNIKVQWPSPESLSFITKDDTGLASLYLLTPKGDLTKVIDEENGLRAVWSANGRQVLYSTLESGLVIYDTETSSRQRQSLLARADLCVWALVDDVICALDDKGTTRIEKLNSKDGQVSTLATNLIIYPKQILISSDGQFLVIQSQSDLSLYGLKLTSN